MSIKIEPHELKVLRSTKKYQVSDKLREGILTFKTLVEGETGAPIQVDVTDRDAILSLTVLNGGRLLQLQWAVWEEGGELCGVSCEWLS